MGVGKKFDYPPLLAPGRHTLSLSEIKAKCADAFPNSARRRHLLQCLEKFVQAYLTSGICCEIWLDGSFLTTKPDPSDLDVTVILDADVPDLLTEEQQRLIDDTSQSRFADDVDSFAFAKRRRDDPYFGDESLDAAYSWGQQYGLECSENWLKGFVVIKLRETNVGLRICI